MARSILRQPVWLDFVRGRKASPPLAMQRWIRLQFATRHPGLGEIGIVGTVAAIANAV